MKEYFDQIRDQLRSELARSAVGYLRAGLELFHKERSNSYPSIQPAFGNLGIAIELMLKTFLVKHNPSLIFRDLPLDLQIGFACPEAELSGFNKRYHKVNLLSFNYKTVELDDCISSFFLLCQKSKQELKPYFRLLSRSRNLSVHASLPSIQYYQLERTAYLALHLYDILAKTGTFNYHFYFLTEEDKKYLSCFGAERTERVGKKIEAAKEKAKTLSHDACVVYEEGWEYYSTHCPVCRSGGLLSGSTEMEGVPEIGGGIAGYVLNFNADSFKCGSCGLLLEDVEELRLANMETKYDRNQDTDQWTNEVAPDLESREGDW